ncbi:hypothetical protein OHA72_31565 [Dactylosporangium sp. NBC_01737]|uniref:hypothetical protein n=1 Tax=Dactylosporangium sp. NBC_01737 TaxID=2975959 RepID=UPI002E0FD716|nr:hypothetical protein OHA72_31565 [Dactylosporangium sp. NBC_01737]
MAIAPYFTCDGDYLGSGQPTNPGLPAATVTGTGEHLTVTRVTVAVTTRDGTSAAAGDRTAFTWRA